MCDMGEGGEKKQTATESNTDDSPRATAFKGAVSEHTDFQERSKCNNT